MMPLLMGLDTIWWKLESLEREHHAAARRPGFKYYDDFDDQEARSGRVQRVRMAVSFSGVEAGDMLVARLSGLDLQCLMRCATTKLACEWRGALSVTGNAPKACIWTVPRTSLPRATCC
jgi:hypothetical protein